MKLGYNIRKIREIRNIKQEHVAHELDISLTSYGKIERDEVEISIKRANQIALILGISLITLVGYEDEFYLKNQANLANQSSFEFLIQHLQNTIAALNQDKSRLLSIIEKMSSTQTVKALGFVLVFLNPFTY